MLKNNKQNNYQQRAIDYWTCLMGSNTSITLPKPTALFLVKHDLINDQTGMLVCKDFANDDGDYVEVIPEDLTSLIEDESYQEFQIWTK